jgi:hypothetical protein
MMYINITFWFLFPITYNWPNTKYLKILQNFIFLPICTVTIVVKLISKCHKNFVCNFNVHSSFSFLSKPQFLNLSVIPSLKY